MNNQLSFFADYGFSMFFGSLASGQFCLFITFRGKCILVVCFSNGGFALLISRQMLELLMNPSVALAADILNPFRKISDAR